MLVLVFAQAIVVPKARGGGVRTIPLASGWREVFGRIKGTSGTDRKRPELGLFIKFFELVGYVSRCKLVCV